MPPSSIWRIVVRGFFKVIALPPWSRFVEHAHSEWLQFRAGTLFARLQRCGPGCTIARPFAIEGPENIRLGARVSIAAFVHIWGQGGVTIGDDTMIGSHVAITSLTHDTDAAGLYRQTLVKRPVIIGNNVWIGAHAVILPGVTIGDSAVIGANSTVLHDVPPGAIAVGSPARVSRLREGPGEASHDVR